MSATILKFRGEPMTKREIEIAREAYMHGAAVERGHGHDVGGWKPEAERRYPLPKVARPRVAPDPNEPAYEWSVRDGVLHFRWLHTSENNWKRASGLYENMLLTPTHSRVALWADLFAHPTEMVEDDA